MSIDYNKNKSLPTLNPGLSHWKLQRLSAIFIIPLIIWFISSILMNMSTEYTRAVEWIINPINSILLIMLLAGIFFHSGMGLQVVFEDYVSNSRLRKIIIFLSNLTLLFLAIISITSILTILLF